MEKFSSFERVVGSISENEKQRILQEKGEVFDDQVFEELRGREREKTSEELQIISLANKATNEIRRKYGMDDFEIPSDNIHVITEEAWPKEKGDAFYNSTLQGIAAREQPAKIVFLKKVLHEMLHFKSYNALQVTKGVDPELAEYRVGLTVHARDGKRIYFVNLNEAVTEEMTKRLFLTLSQTSLFTEEARQTEKVITRYPRAVTRSGDSLFDEDTFYAEVEGKKSWKESVGRLFGAQEEPKKITTEGFTYQSERRVLNILIDKILERNHDTFQNRDEVFDIFAEGMMTGNLLTVGRLIERTFGSGTLRRIGELDSDIKAQEKFVHAL